MKLPVYLDYNATTPVDERVLEAMLPYYKNHFGNAASRNHSFGWAAEEAVKIAREQTAALIDCEPNEIVFTSGATESINLAIKGVYERFGKANNHIITVKTEHKAVLDTCESLEKKGAEITYLNVDVNGLISIDELINSIKQNTILIAVMMVNNETGVVQPVHEIGCIAKERNILFFCDATQAPGKTDIKVREINAALLSLSAHKMYGPKGVGALFVSRKNPRVQLSQQINGGNHEKGLRSGTLNVPGIVGMGKAASLIGDLQTKERITELRNLLEKHLLEIDDVFINGYNAMRAGNVSNICFKYVDAESLMMAMNKMVAASTGSACSSASLAPSHVLTAMGLSEQDANSCIRFSLGKYNETDEIVAVIQQVKKAVKVLRNESAAWQLAKGLRL